MNACEPEWSWSLHLGRIAAISIYVFIGIMVASGYQEVLVLDAAYLDWYKACSNYGGYPFLDKDGYYLCLKDDHYISHHDYFHPGD